MCKVNKTATFKEVFSDVELTDSILCSSLSESTLAEKIYKLRKKLNLTQREFSKLTGVGYSTICKYESGLNASKNNLKKICNALDLPYTYFIFK